MLLSNLNYWNMKCYSRERSGATPIGCDFLGKVIGWGRKICSNAWFVNVSCSQSSFCFCFYSSFLLSIIPLSSGFWHVSFELTRDSVWRGLFEVDNSEQPCLSTGGERNCLFDQLRAMCTEAGLLVSLGPKALSRIQNNSCLLQWTDQRIFS